MKCVKSKGSVDIKAYCCASLVLRHGQAFSPIYRFSLSDGTIVSAHTKSKLVRSPATNEPQLYMSLHILQRYVSVFARKRKIKMRELDCKRWPVRALFPCCLLHFV